MISDSDKQNMMVGYKQTLKAINDGKADRVFLAENCEDKIRLSVENAANGTDVSLMYVKTMRDLGSMCGIEVGASCAVILK
jgi:large subunit ribosomal protein L7A